MRKTPITRAPLFAICAASISWALAAAAQTTPSILGTQATGASQPAAQNVSPDTPDTNPDRDPPPVLSGSSVEKRARIHICGAEWLQMEKSGAAFGKDWRDFSRDCYARPLPAGALPAGGSSQDDVLVKPSRPKT